MKLNHLFQTKITTESLSLVRNMNPVLNESTFFSGKMNTFKTNDEITVLKNPSFIKLQGLMNKSKKGELRGLITYDDDGAEEYYFWDASVLNHWGFYNKFGFGDDDSDVNFILTKDSILFPVYMIHPEAHGIKDEERLHNIKCDMEMVTQDHTIQKLYPNGFKIGVSY